MVLEQNDRSGVPFGSSEKIASTEGAPVASCRDGARVLLAHALKSVAIGQWPLPGDRPARSEGRSLPTLASGNEDSMASLQMRSSCALAKHLVAPSALFAVSTRHDL